MDAMLSKAAALKDRALAVQEEMYRRAWSASPGAWTTLEGRLLVVASAVWVLEEEMVRLDPEDAGSRELSSRLYEINGVVKGALSEETYTAAWNRWLNDRRPV